MEQKNSPKDNSKAEYTVNDKAVSKAEFNKFLSGLKEINATWFCAETKTGGITGYDAKDKNGIVYEYRANSDSNDNSSSIRKKTVLK